MSSKSITKTKKQLSGLLVLAMSSIAYAQTPINYDQANTFETGGPMPNFVSSEDMNNDGHVDLLVSTERKLHFLLGDGTGILEKRATIRLNATGTGAALGDFDGDGSLDIAISVTTAQTTEAYWYNNYQAIQTTDIYLNDGAVDPTFTKLSSLPYYGVNSKFQAEDFNADGLDDLMINGHILLSQGDGNFLESDSIIISDYYQNKISGTFTTDINNDGNIDIIYPGLSTNYCGNGDGSFFECYDYIVPAGGIVADFNGDGLMDQITTQVVSFKQIPYTVYSGGGCGTVVSYSYSGRRGSRHRGGRGRIRRTRCFPSYKVTRYRSEPETSQVLVRLQNNDGTFEEITSPIIDGEIVQLDVIDMDGDALTDVALRLKNQSGLSVFRGLGGGELSVLEPVADAPSVLNFEDFNEDGLPDIIYVGLSIPSKPDSDAWAFLHLQSSSASNSTAGTGATTGTTTPQTTPTTPTGTNPGSSSNSNFPAIDPNGETLELAGTISELYNDHFVIQNTTIWYDNSATFKYESGFILEVGQSAQVEANPNVDGSGTAIKVQVGPL
jgi:FG-GAP-like repeat/Domain of unknown function (DUF5666)